MLSIVVVYYDKDEHFMKTLVKSLPKWAEWVFVKSVQDGTDETVTSVNNIITANYNYTGEFDFMKSKNYAKQFATKKWILWLDDDEHLDVMQHDYLKDLIENLDENVGGAFCTQYSRLAGLVVNGISQRSATPTVRISRNIPPVKWEWYIHDVLEHSIEQAGYTIADTNLSILHDGWDIPKQQLMDRLERNIKAIWRHPDLMNELTYKRYYDYLIEMGYTYKKLKEE